MSNGRLGSFESELDIGMQFLGWFGQEGGGVQSLQQEEAAEDSSPDDMRAQFIRSEMAMDRDTTSSGAANAPRIHRMAQHYAPKTFLEQHPSLKKFLKQKYPNHMPWDRPQWGGLGELGNFDIKTIGLVAVVVIALGVGYHLHTR